MDRSADPCRTGFHVQNFSFRPTTAYPNASPKSLRRSINRRGSETILVVEDEPPVLWTVRNILERHGYHVLEAATGVEALAVWHQHQKDIALLLTDMVMPVGLSGQELLKNLKCKPTSK